MHLFSFLDLCFQQQHAFECINSVSQWGIVIQNGGQTKCCTVHTCLYSVHFDGTKSDSAFMRLETEVFLYEAARILPKSNSSLPQCVSNHNNNGTGFIYYYFSIVFKILYVCVCFRMSVQRVRKPRCCKGPQGLLPRFSSTQADGQEQLFHLTDNIHSE